MHLGYVSVRTFTHKVRTYMITGSLASVQADQLMADTLV